MSDAKQKYLDSQAAADRSSGRREETGDDSSSNSVRPGREERDSVSTDEPGGADNIYLDADILASPTFDGNVIVDDDSVYGGRYDRLPGVQISQPQIPENDSDTTGVRTPPGISRPEIPAEDLKRESTYTFRSSGIRATQIDPIRQKFDPVQLQFVGFKTPLEKEDAHSTVFRMHTEIEDQVEDNLRNLLLTNKGERLGRFNYGGSLRELTYELLGNENYEGIIMARIKEAVDNFLPFVELNSFSSEKIDISNNGAAQSMTKVTVAIDYNIPKIGVSGKRLQFNLFVGG